MKIVCIMLTVVLSSGCTFVSQSDFLAHERRDTFQAGLVAFNGGLFETALKHLEESAQEGNVDAQYLTGLIYLNGLDGQTNVYQAEKYFVLSATQGHVASQVQLAHLYQNTNVPLYNPLAAYHWFKIVIQSNPQYQYQMDNLRWTLQNQGVLTQAQKLDLPVPRFTGYRGIDYNTLFPPR